MSTRKLRSPIAHRLRFPCVQPFELRLSLFGHGFVDLAPHVWDGRTGRFTSALAIGGRAVDALLVQKRGALELRLDTETRLSKAALAEARNALVRMLQLDQDFGEFWRLCREVPRLSWVARRGAGRLLCSPSLFEDLVKLLFTTNCSWSATRGMASRLVEALGQKTPSGARAFPDPASLAAEPERFYRDVVRCGYRAPFVRELAHDFALGRLRPEQFEDRRLSTDEVRRRLLALPGIGPYAAGQALRLLGRYCDFALDSWCNNRLTELRGSTRPPSERALGREYRSFGDFRGLALWMDLTASWHGEGTPTTRGLW